MLITVACHTSGLERLSPKYPYRFRDITTITVYVTVCDLENSKSFDKIVDRSRTLSISYVNISWLKRTRPICSELWALERLQSDKVTFDVTQGHWFCAIR